MILGGYIMYKIIKSIGSDCLVKRDEQISNIACSLTDGGTQSMPESHVHNNDLEHTPLFNH